MKKVVALIPFLIASLSVSAADPVQKKVSVDLLSDPMLPLYLVITFIFIVIILLFAVMITALRVLRMFAERNAKEKAVIEGIAYVPPVSFFTKVSRRLNDSVPIEKEKDIDIGHDFDGIRELDNHLPPWWTWLFTGSVGWSIVYLIVFHVSASMPLSIEEYDNEITAANEKKRLLLASQPHSIINVDSLEYKMDVPIIAKGKVTFDSYCVACHRKDGAGNTIGPNLTDLYWLHGGGIKNVFNTIDHGYVEKGMPAWGKSLSPSEVRDVAFFVMSLQGSNPVDGKAPQGNLENIQSQQPGDSTKTSASL
ncbi:MAG: cbb3-type cytochrome c oxidase N-terminal domain-containing protein [Chryseolinea sp.]